MTVRRTCQAGGKPELSEPTTRVRRGGRLTDKSYSRDNRLVPPKSSYRRRSSAPRCRLTLARRRRSCQAFGCSPIKKVRELGSDRLEPHPIPLLTGEGARKAGEVMNSLNPQRNLNLMNCFNRNQSYCCLQYHGGTVYFLYIVRS